MKRVIALPGQRVNIDGDGNIYIDNVMLDEPCLAGKAAGQSVG
ncbi:MAG: S26 family signal peptidase [Eubacteriales bacterium]|nr:S26 family signal peptidase [Eubacteriales bacterium]